MLTNRAAVALRAATIHVRFPVISVGLRVLAMRGVHVHELVRGDRARRSQKDDGDCAPQRAQSANEVREAHRGRTYQ